MATEEAAPAPGVRVRELRASFAGALRACGASHGAGASSSNDSRLWLVPPRDARREDERETRAMRATTGARETNDD